MPDHDQSIREVYARHAKVLVDEPQNGNGSSVVVRTLLGLEGDIGRMLSRLKRDEYAKARLLELVSQDLLNSTIEDDYVDLTHELRAARVGLAQALRQLLERDNWIDQPLSDCFEILQEIATKQREPLVAELLGAVPIRGRLAPPGQTEILVSSRQYPFVPILEDSIGDPTYARSIFAAFAARLERLRGEEGVNCLCFVEKVVGPVGALFMVSNLVSELGLPACIYRAKHWAKRAKLVGYQPRANDRLALVYDLLVTGDGLTQAALDLRETYGAKVSAATVLFAYDERTVLKLDDGESVRVEAIERYGNFAEDIQSVRACLEEGRDVQNPRVQVLSNWNGGSHSGAPAVRRRTRSGSPKGGAVMKAAKVAPNSSPEWRPYLSQYRKLSALKFVSEEQANAAIDLLWSEDLIDLPHEPVGEDTIIVPEEAVPLFRAAGLDFTETEVLSAGDLPAEEITSLRREQGPY